MRVFAIPAAIFALALSFQPAQSHEWLDYFDYGRVELSSHGYQTARSVAGYAVGRGDYLITIKGHMDTAEAQEFSNELASRRAQSMATEFVALGVDPARIRMTARGATQLARATTDDVAEPLNRRLVVDVNLTSPR